MKHVINNKREVEKFLENCLEHPKVLEKSPFKELPIELVKEIFSYVVPSKSSTSESIPSNHLDCILEDLNALDRAENDNPLMNREESFLYKSAFAIGAFLYGCYYGIQALLTEDQLVYEYSKTHAIGGMIFSVGLVASLHAGYWDDRNDLEKHLSGETNHHED